MTRRYDADPPEKKPRIDYVKCLDCGAGIAIRDEDGVFSTKLLGSHHTQHARATMYELYGEDESLWPKPHDLILAAVGAIPPKRPNTMKPVVATTQHEPVAIPTDELEF